MTWKFFHEIHGVRDWPDRFDPSEYPVQYYVEKDAKTKLGFFGASTRGLWIFELSGHGLAFEFHAYRTGAFVGTQKNDLESERNLGPVCKVWIDKSDIARISQADARIIISEISEGLLESPLLANIPRSEWVGPNLTPVIFGHEPFQEMNSAGGRPMMEITAVLR
jgi:hypothetical protein